MPNDRVNSYRQLVTHPDFCVTHMTLHNLMTAQNLPAEARLEFIEAARFDHAAFLQHSYKARDLHDLLLRDDVPFVDFHLSIQFDTLLQQQH